MQVLTCENKGVYSVSVSITPPFPISLASVVAPWRRGISDPLAQAGTRPDRTGATTYWATTRSGQTDILLRFHQEKGTARSLREKYLAPIHIRLWAPRTPQSPEDIENLLTQLPRWVGTEDNWREFQKSPQWNTLPETLIRAHQEHPGVRLGATGEIFKNTVASITEQRVTGIEAMGGLRAILRQTASAAPQTGLPDQPRGMLFFPSPQTLASLPSWIWHRAGYDRARADTIVSFAQRAESIERLAQKATADQLSVALSSIRGIGPWTIAEVLQRTHGHPDAISVGDFHLAHHVGWVFEGQRATDEQMVRLLAPFSGNRNRVVALIKAAGIQEPRRAPRYSPQDHRSH